MAKIKYMVIEQTSIVKLEEEVESLLNVGWKLQGGVSISTVKTDMGGYREKYAQAMTKEGK